MCRKVKCSAQRFRLPISLGYFGNTLDLSFSQVEAHYAYVRLHTRDKASLVPSRSLAVALCNIVVVFNGFSLSQSKLETKDRRRLGEREREREIVPENGELLRSSLRR